MKSACLLSVVLLSLTTLPVLAANKCVNEHGQVVYQSAPCPTTAKGSEITLQKAPPAPVTSPTDAEELKRIQQTASAMERERRLLEIDREIGSAESRITGYRQSMSNELDRLRRKKQYANNNLAGATWEQSISDEMNAVTQKYDALIRDDQSQIERLRNDADRLRKTTE